MDDQTVEIPVEEESRLIEPHEFDRVLTLKEAARKVTNNKKEKRGKTTLLLALRKGEIIGYVNLPGENGRVGIPKRYWKRIGRENIEDTKGTYKITGAALVQVVAARAREARESFLRQIATPLDDEPFPELAVWFRSRPNQSGSRLSHGDIVIGLAELVETVARFARSKMTVFLREIDVKPYIGGADGRKRMKPGKIPPYMEERFWVTLFGFFDAIDPDFDQKLIVDQMTVWCNEKFGKDISGKEVYSRWQIEDKVRLAYQQLAKVKRNGGSHPALKSSR